MRVNSIFATNFNQKKAEQGGVKNNILINLGQNRVSSYYPPLRTAISFNGIKGLNIQQLTELSKLHDLPCIYCGKKMISQKVFDSIKHLHETRSRTLGEFLTTIEKTEDTLTEEEGQVIEKLLSLSSVNSKIPMYRVADWLKVEGFKLSPKFTNMSDKTIPPAETSAKIIKLIDPHKDSLRPIEQAVFDEIKQYIANNPNSSIQKALISLRPKYLKQLVTEEFQVLEDIDNIAEDLSDESRQKLLGLTHINREIIISDSLRNPFKRKEFIHEIYNITREMPERIAAKEIYTKALTLPTSSTSVSAFVVKYSGGKGIKKGTAETLEEIILPNEKNIFRSLVEERNKISPQKEITDYILEKYPESVASLSSSRKNIVDSITSNVDENLHSIRFKKEMIIKQVKKMQEDKKYTNKPTALRQVLINTISNEFENILSKNEFDSLMTIAKTMPYDKNEGIVALIVENPKQARKIHSELTPEVINRIYPEVHNILLDEQDKIMTKLSTEIDEMCKKFEKNFYELTLGYSEKDQGEQKDILNKIKKLNSMFNMKTFNLITQPLKSQPKSINDINAFVVKYAKSPLLDKDNIPDFMRRADKEIGFRLISSSRISIEHIKPQTIFRYENSSSGMNDISNLSLADAYCNSSIRQDKVVSKELETYIQRQLDYIIEKINNGTLKSCDNYPEMLKKAYFEQSNGQIILDTSKLKQKVSSN